MARVITPITSQGEQLRKVDLESLGQSQTHTEIGWSFGVITHIDAETKMVKVTDPATKLPVCSNMNITLGHSVRWLNDMCGQVRIGMLVLVLYKGARSGAPMAVAFIIGDEGEGVADTRQNNDVGIKFGQSLIGA